MNAILLILSIIFGVLLVFEFKTIKYQPIIILVSRVFVGLVFSYSGFVKAVDPLGYTYKIVDYFTAFGFPSMDNIAFMLAVFFSTVEFLLGFGLIFGIFIRLNTYLVTLFMLVFTPLTFYLAISNPVTDCGCFGDALVITNWQTFWKNIIINSPVLILLLQRKNIKDTLGTKPAVLFTILALVIISTVSIYSYRHLPIFDFRPYKIGNNITEGMQMPEGAKTDIYQSTFTYKNTETGEMIEFTEDQLDEPLSNEEKWEFIDSQSVLLEEGYHPPIHDFSIVSNQTGDVTEQVLNDSNYTLLLISYDLDKINKKALLKFERLSKTLEHLPITCMGLTAALDDEVTRINEYVKKELSYDTVLIKNIVKDKVYFYEYEGNVLEFTEDNLSENLGSDYTYIGEEEMETEEIRTADLAFRFYICDPTTLKTIVRANPGVVLLKKGTIINKWHYNDLPTAEKLEEIMHVE